METIVVAALLLIFVGLVGVVFVGVANMRREVGELRERAAELEANLLVARGKRRGLIAQLVAHAAAYVQHERDAMADAASLSPSMNMSGLAFVTLAGQKYPQLKADGTYLVLMTQVSAIEAELQTKVEDYNAAVRLYNGKAAPAPAFFAWAYDHRPLEYAKAFEDDSEVVRSP
jgi:hypothetical protein